MNALCRSKDDLKNVDFALVSEMVSMTLTALVLDINDAVTDLSISLKKVYFPMKPIQ